MNPRYTPTPGLYENCISIIFEATDLVELVKTAAVSVESRGRGPVIFFLQKRTRGTSTLGLYVN